MRLLTRDQARLLDEQTIQNRPQISHQLMLEASQAVERELRRVLSKSLKKSSTFLILIGPGNNGCDAILVGSSLLRSGFNVNFFCSSTLAKCSPLTRELVRQNALQLLSPKNFEKSLQSCEVVIDGLFGTGLDRDLSAELVHLIHRINEAQKLVVSIDIPSGLDANTGWGRPVSIKATLTLTFAKMKPGLIINQGPQVCGQIVAALLSFSLQLVRKIAVTHFAFGKEGARKIFPRRQNLSNKGNHGKVMIVGGSKEYPGAGLLAAQASLRGGAGYTYLVCPSGLFDGFQEIPEVILKDYALFKESLDQRAVWVIGPGVDQSIEGILRQMIHAQLPWVIADASVFSALSRIENQKLPASWILTPHPGELAKVLGISVQEINSDRCAWALRASRMFGCLLVLKGFRTIVSDGRRVFIIMAGNSGLAKAGSGDVLAGLIGALLSQGRDPLKAALLGCFVHGYIADLWKKSGNSVLALTASDLIKELPKVLGLLEERPRKS